MLMRDFEAWQPCLLHVGKIDSDLAEQKGSQLLNFNIFFSEKLAFHCAHP
jgi:hypothetical protein